MASYSSKQVTQVVKTTHFVKTSLNDTAESLLQALQSVPPTAVIASIDSDVEETQLCLTFRESASDIEA